MKFQRFDIDIDFEGQTLNVTGEFGYGFRYKQEYTTNPFALSPTYQEIPEIRFLRIEDIRDEEGKKYEPENIFLLEEVVRKEIENGNF